jgi:hypothetical protein
MFHETATKATVGGARRRRSERWAAPALGPALTLALLGLAAAAGPAGAATLRWKFKPGEALHYQMDQKTVTQIKLSNQDANNPGIKTTNTQVIDMTWKVGSVAADGTAEVTQTIDRLQTKIEMPGAAFEYDSKADKAPEGPIAAAVVPMLKALVGARFEFKMTPRGELSDVKIPESLVKALKEAGPAASGGMFTEDGLKNMIHESSLALPDEDLAKGKSWDRSAKMPPSPIGVMTLAKTYTYEGPADSGEKIGLSVKMSLEPAADNKIDVKIGAQDGKGTFIFDNKAGRVATSNVSEKVDMTISVMNQQITQNLETSTSMKLLDGNIGATK